MSSVSRIRRTIASLFFPCWPAQALGLAHGIDGPLLVERRGSVASCSPELCDQGVRPGDAIERVLKTVGQMPVLAEDPLVQQAMWDELVNAAHQISPNMQCPESGRIWLHIDSSAAFERVLSAYRPQVGIARTQSLALLAATSSRAGHYVFVPEQDESAFLANFSLRTLRWLGYGSDVLEKLTLFGLHTMADLRPLSERHLKAQFGDQGRRLYELLESIDHSDTPGPYQPPLILSDGVRFEDPVCEPADLLPAVVAVARTMAYRLEGRHTSILTMRFFNRAEEQIAMRRRVLPEPLGQQEPLGRACESLARLLLAKPRMIERFRIDFGGLFRPQPSQPLLFPMKQKLATALYHMERRHPGAALKGVVLNPDAYLPEQRFTIEHFALPEPERRSSKKSRVRA